MTDLLLKILPELLLVAVACVLILLGCARSVASRRLTPWIALAALVTVFIYQLYSIENPGNSPDPTGTVTVGAFPEYVRLLVSGVGILLVLLAWPTNADATGSDSMNFGADAGEFFALMLLSITGVLLVGASNDIILLFLGIELASIPTYIMVSVSRPLAVAQEAGVKYFFLGAMAAALMLFGFSYLYGTTGLTKLDAISNLLHPAGSVVAHLSTWQTLAVVMLLSGFAFKIAAVPLHAYAGDVYQGAATPVTAFLAFIPKTSGFLAIIKILSAVGGPHWVVPTLVIHLLWIVAALTMSVGNVLALLPLNVKRVLAYSSVAHSGYMLVGVTALIQASQTFPHDPERAALLQQMALGGVLFYLAAYGVMNAGAFGVLMLLPSRGATEPWDPGVGKPAPATTAETYDDLAGQGKKHVALGLAMAVCCFSLIGIPLTIGFVGKFYLIRPALEGGLFWLVVILVVNAAVSAAYYLRIVATMFLRPAAESALAPAGVEPPVHGHAPHHFAPHGLAALAHAPAPLAAGVLLSVVGTLLFGTIVPATNGLTGDVENAGAALTILNSPNPVPQASAVAARHTGD